VEEKKEKKKKRRKNKKNNIVKGNLDTLQDEAVLPNVFQNSFSSIRKAAPSEKPELEPFS
jgi:hypothetical protein